MGGGGGGGLPPFLWEGRELPPFFNGREGMTSFIENPRLRPEAKALKLVPVSEPISVDNLEVVGHDSNSSVCVGMM